MGIKVANNAYGTLNASITSTDTSLTLSGGQGARFPTLAAGDYFYATLIDTGNNLEIVKCTARASDVLTITRGQESTTARAYTVGDRVELRITAATFDDATAIGSGDVTAALGYTPVNNTGDTITGSLTVTGTVTSTLQHDNGYFEIGSYSIGAYGDGHARMYMDYNANRLKMWSKGTDGSNNPLSLYLPHGGGLEWAGSSVLDDYEEGTWSPTLVGETTAGTQTYSSTPWGYYTKIGNIVNVHCGLYVSNHTGTGRALIKGLPFACEGEAVGTAQVNTHGDAWPSDLCSIASIIQGGETQIHMRGTYANTTSGPYYINCQNFTYLRISIQYVTLS